MIGLGVADDQPPDHYQPPLTKGIHLRWGFRRELGFPWYGFYLFRRAARSGRALCLSAVTGGLSKEITLGSKHHTAIGVLSSDANLILTDDFAPNTTNRVEFDLERRKFLRFELPEGESARRVQLSVGLRQACMSVERLIQPPVEITPGQIVTRPSPLTARGITFEVLSPTRAAQFTLVNTNAGPLVGLMCGNSLSIRLSTASDGVELLLTRANSETAPTVAAYNVKGRLVASAQMRNPFNQPEAVRLKGRGITRVEVKQPVANSAYLHRICADSLGEEGRKVAVKVTAYSGTTPVRSVLVSGQQGSVVSTIIDADAITSIEVGTGPAALIDLCYVLGAQDATTGWQRIPGLMYPLGLPVTQPDYPCGTASPEALLTQRVHYPWPPGWDASAFAELHDQLKELVKGGPGSEPMADRIFAEPKSSTTPPDEDPPGLSKFYILDMILLASLHPALAQAVGLYWVDREVAPGAAYDYLIVADHTGIGQRNAGRVLSVIRSSGFAQLDGYIVFNKRAAADPPLMPPTGLEAQGLPGGTFPDAQGDLPQSSNNAGLRWDVGWDDSDALLPQSALMYLVWRADLGDDETPAPASAYDLITKLPPDEPRPVMVSEPRLPNSLPPERPPDWPQRPLYFIDRNLKDRWFGYRVSGVDLFGRHSEQSQPVQLRLLDRIPPPSPTGVEAYALDPEDPYLQQDTPYKNWRDALDGSVRETLVGLRVRWRWTTAHRRQSLDTREFRIYFHPGATLPNAHDQAINWQERYFVVDYKCNFQIDPNNDDRVYEVFIPPADSANLVSIPLNPTTTEPVVYAHVGVSAADDKQHAKDLRVGGQWGDRFGNEGGVVSAKIHRVLREPPPPPEDVLGGERLYASPADYYGRSFFTYRWKPRPDMMLHVFRALDDGVFNADWARRPSQPTLDASQLELFPPGWNAATRQAVAGELNHLNTLVGTDEGDAQAAAYYRQLSDAALRVLAGLPTSEDAFVQLTINPLDPDQPSSADRKGPDTSDEYQPDLSLRAFIDTLDGRAANRYFYRAAFVNGAHNLGPLGLSSPPVYLHKVVPPRTPVITKILGGERQVTLRWAANRDPDLAGYRIYRTGSEESARDVRLMDLAATLTQADIYLSDPTVEWTDDGGLVGGHKYFYRLAAVDTSGNESGPTNAYWVVAVDTRVPPAPIWTDNRWLLRSIENSSLVGWPADGVVPEGYVPLLRLGWQCETPEPTFVVTRWSAGEQNWRQPAHIIIQANPLNASEFILHDHDVDPSAPLAYRLKVCSSSGVWSADEAFLTINPPETDGQ